MKELKRAQLRRVCDPKGFGFQTTAELPLPEMGTLINQERAQKAIERALEISDFHVYIFGPHGVGRETLVSQILKRVALGRSTPGDLCAIFNFTDRWVPRMISLPAGQGVEFATQMKNFVKELSPLIRGILKSPSVTEPQKKIAEDAEAQVDAIRESFRAELEAAGAAWIETQRGMGIGPNPRLPKEQQASKKAIYELNRHLEQGSQEITNLTQRAEQRIQALAKKLIKEEVTSRLEPLAIYGPKVSNFIEEVAESVVENFLILVSGETEAQSCGTEGQSCGVEAWSLLKQYEVNVLVDNAGISGAPVVFEPNSTYHNLMGVIEYVPTSSGVPMTDHTYIRPGSLHQANGGFLVLDIGNLLKQPFGSYVYEALKMALRTRELSLEPFGREAALFPTRSLKPEPVPLNVKVILLGEPEVFEILGRFDPEFRDLFRVRAEFEVDMPRTLENEGHYASFIRIRGEQTGILPFDPVAVAKVVEYGSRLAGDQGKLSLRFGAIDELLREASLVASQQGNSCVTAGDVCQALEDRIHRLNYIEERIRERLKEGTLLVDTEGKAIGQINGLGVISVDEEYSFGSPSRITARTFAGRKGEVVDIFREVGLSGPSHSKGVLILCGWFGGKYAQKQPLTLSASLTFEQDYGPIDGDSASAAELFALLSSLSTIPLRQGVAVTGSVDQYGQIQPIGGVNKKIEGWFDSCRIKGSLTGEQGVIIPIQNIKDLMLREDVVEAVDQDKFHVWPIRSIDEGIELLTGVLAGELREDGTYPEGTVNRAVDDKLTSYTKVMKQEKAGILERLLKRLGVLGGRGNGEGM